MFGRKAKETARKFKDSEPKVDDVKAPDVDLGESFRKADSEAPKAEKKKSFKEAFSGAADGSVFTWNGKQYKKEYAKKEEATRPGGRGSQTRSSTGPDSKKSASPAAKPAAAAAGAAAGAAGRYMTRGGGSAPSGAGGLGFESLKAKRDDFYAKMEARRKAMGMKEPPKPDLSIPMEIPALKAKRDDFYAKQKAYREAKGMKDQPAPDLTPGQIPALKARSDDFYAKLKANRETKGMAKGGTVESKEMMKKEVAFMKKKGAPKSMVKHEMAEAKGMNMGGMTGYKSGGSCGSGMKKYARGGGVESHGKTKGTMVKMASGGSVSARADGIASKGKTNCKIC